MKFYFQYENTEERHSIIENNQEKYLIEERNVAEGNFLIFTDEKPLSEAFEDLKQAQSETDSTLLELMEIVILGGM